MIFFIALVVLVGLYLYIELFDAGEKLNTVVKAFC